MDMLSIRPELASDVIKLLSSKLDDSKSTVETLNAEKSRLLEQNQDFQERTDALNSKLEKYYDKVAQLSEQNELLRCQLAGLPSNHDASGHVRAEEGPTGDCSDAACTAAMTVETLRVDLEVVRKRLSALEHAKSELQWKYISQLVIELAIKPEYQTLRGVVEEYRIMLDVERTDDQLVQQAAVTFQTDIPALESTMSYTDEVPMQDEIPAHEMMSGSLSSGNVVHVIPFELSPWKLPPNIVELLPRGAASILLTSCNLILFQGQGNATIISPECRFNPQNISDATSSPRQKLEDFAKRTCDVFVRSRKGTAYIGTYEVSDMSRYSEEEYRALSLPTKRALQANSFTMSKDVLPHANIQRVQNKYHTGQTTARYVSLRLIGFNTRFYSALRKYIEALSLFAADESSESRGEKRKSAKDGDDVAAMKRPKL